MGGGADSAVGETGAHQKCMTSHNRVSQMDKDSKQEQQSSDTVFHQVCQRMVGLVGATRETPDPHQQL